MKSLILMIIFFSIIAINTVEAGEYYLIGNEKMYFVAFSDDEFNTASIFTGEMARRGWVPTPLPLGTDGKSIPIVTLECFDPKTGDCQKTISSKWFGTPELFLEFQEEINQGWLATLKKMMK